MLYRCFVFFSIIKSMFLIFSFYQPFSFGKRLKISRSFVFSREKNLYWKIIMDCKRNTLKFSESREWGTNRKDLINSHSNKLSPNGDDLNLFTSYLQIPAQILNTTRSKRRCNKSRELFFDYFVVTVFTSSISLPIKFN